MINIQARTQHLNKYHHVSLFLQGFEFQIRVVVMASVTLLPDFRAEHRIWVHERDCSLQEPQQARHLCRHFAYSTAGVLQLPERPEKEKNPERKLIHSQESIKHFLLKSYCQTELECCQVTSQILEHQVNQHRSTIYKALMKHT